MPDGFVQLPPDSTGKKQSMHTRDPGTGLVYIPRVVTMSDRIVAGRVGVSTFRTLGNAAVTHNVFSLENGAASTVNVALRRLTVQMDTLAALIAVAPTIKTSRPTAIPTGGTALSKAMFETAGASHASVVARGANASDGGAATAIVATAGATLWTQYAMRQHTLVGQVLIDDNSLVPNIAVDNPIIILPGQAILVTIIAAVATSNPATNHYVLNAAWEEFTS